MGSGNRVRRRAHGVVVLALAVFVAVGTASVPGGWEAAATTPEPPSVRSVSPTTTAAPRAVPAYAQPDGSLRVRTAGTSGSTDLPVRPAASGTRVWGDWNGDGVVTPAVFRSGTWTIYDSVVGYRLRATRTFTYGTSGDTPVAGDWNGDGRTGIGVVRAGTWYLREYATGGSTQRKFRYGTSTDRPLVGDWDGDRGSDVGVWRAGRWLLRRDAGSGPAQISFSYGRSTDIPVTGDWNGDRKHSPAVVRGTTWYERDHVSGGAAQRQVVVPAPSGSKPVPWTTPSGFVSGRCPTARPGGDTARASLAAQVKAPVPVTSPAPTDTTTSELKQSLASALRYTTGPGLAARFGSSPTAYTDVLGGSSNTEHAVRPPAMASVAASTALYSGGWDATAVGRSRSEGTALVGWLVRSISCQHTIVTPGGWGYGWQSAYWAYHTGMAAWLVWDTLPPQTKGYVAAMVTAEADRVARMPVTYWRDRDGNELTPGDSKAEENSWNANVLQLAVAMMPGHKNRDAWRAKDVQLSLSAYSRPADLTSDEVINGVHLGEWLQGTNVNDDGTVVNHDRINPDYMSTVQQNWSSALVHSAAGRGTPAAAFHGGPEVDGAFTRRDFPVPDFQDPGGVIYQEPLGVYFPEGTTWGAGRRSQFVNLDAQASAFGMDGGDGTAETWLQYHLAEQRGLQARNSDGRTYLSTTEDKYPGREEYVAQQLAFGWLARRLDADGRVTLDNTAINEFSTASTTPLGPTSAVPGPRDEPQLSP